MKNNTDKEAARIVSRSADVSVLSYVLGVSDERVRDYGRDLFAERFAIHLGMIALQDLRTAARERSRPISDTRWTRLVERTEQTVHRALASMTESELAVVSLNRRSRDEELAKRELTLSLDTPAGVRFGGSLRGVKGESEFVRAIVEYRELARIALNSHPEAPEVYLRLYDHCDFCKGVGTIRKGKGAKSEDVPCMADCNNGETTVLYAHTFVREVK